MQILDPENVDADMAGGAIDTICKLAPNLVHGNVYYIGKKIIVSYKLS